MPRHHCLTSWTRCGRIVHGSGNYAYRVTTIAAVLWDLDGTLVDTEPLWMAAERELAAEFGKAWTDQDGLNLVGRSLLDSGAHIKDHLQLAMEPAEVVDYLVSRMATAMSAHLDWRPGARDLIESVSRSGIPQALVTMSFRPLAEPVLDVIGDFKAVVTGDTVTHGKPHPEPYLCAAAQLGVDPAACVAIEDSPSGASSAEAAGCHVVVVPNYVAVAPSERRTFLTSLEGIGVQDLVRFSGLVMP